MTRDDIIQLNNKPSAWMQELPKEEGIERAVRTTTVKEVADDWEDPIPLYTADDLRAAVLAEREACKEMIATWVESWGNDLTIKEIIEGIRTNGNGATRPVKYVTREEQV